MDSLQHIFIQEATELLSELEEALLAFENNLEDRDSMERIFRAMHTLKGASSMFGFTDVNDFTHELESIYDALREGTLKATPGILELTLEAVDHLGEFIKNPSHEDEAIKKRQKTLLEKIKAYNTGLTPTAPTSIKETGNSSWATFYISFTPGKDILKNGSNPLYLLEDLLELGKGCVLPAFPHLPGFDTLDPTTCYTSFEVLLETEHSEADIEDVFLFVADGSGIKIERFVKPVTLTEALRQKLLDTLPSERPLGLEKVKGLMEVEELPEEDQAVIANNSTKKNILPENKASLNSIRVSSEKLDALMNQISELVTTQARLSMLVNGLEVAELGAITESMSKITRKLRDNAFSICLIPIDTLVVRFQRLVRDLSKELGKNIELITEGTDTELDKSVIEKLSDPLLHLMRNCIDHGIESPAERSRSGKSEKGTIRLEAYNSGTNVIITLSDDGAGIDPGKIRARAIERNIIPADAELSEQETYQLLFEAGFSTAETVSDISGRGVGMDVVKRGLEDLHGGIVIQSEPGKGTKFTIRLPLTLSIIDGLLVEIGENTYVIPLHRVEKCYEIPATLLTAVHQQIVLDGTRMPVFHLGEALQCENTASTLNQVIKLEYEGQEVGVSVDAIIGEHQVVLKPLGHMYKEQEEFSGATILGDGTVALVFDIDRLLKKLISESVKNVNYGKLSYQ
ncbi:MAG: chemotaxis protein CheA [Cytophagales bacterium]|nr:chemotaxis protein CheA [Cytophagales bacterium]